MVVIVALALVMGSERWNGPFTFESLQRAGASASGVRVADPVAPPDLREPGTVYLTFDDGPTRAWTPLVLDVLADHDARATFFPIGSQVADEPGLMRRAVAEGHRIGNHTWGHDRLAGLTPNEFDETVDRTQRAIAGVTGTPPSCLRPPGGVIDQSARDMAASAGLAVASWTVDPSDWRKPGRDAIVDDVITRVRPGAVVLLHDGGGDRSQTVGALDELLDRLGSAGFRFEPLPGC